METYTGRRRLGEIKGVKQAVQKSYGSGHPELVSGSN
jgi:hypothetical protein